jgi:hypothetical protein
MQSVVREVALPCPGQRDVAVPFVRPETRDARRKPREHERFWPSAAGRRYWRCFYPESAYLSRCTAQCSRVGQPGRVKEPTGSDGQGGYVATEVSGPDGRAEIKSQGRMGLPKSFVTPP